VSVLQGGGPLQKLDLILRSEVLIISLCTVRLPSSGSKSKSKPIEIRKDIAHVFVSVRAKGRLIWKLICRVYMPVDLARSKQYGTICVLII
jgi:hypothetical protein